MRKYSGWRALALAICLVAGNGHATTVTGVVEDGDGLAPDEVAL